MMWSRDLGEVTEDIFVDIFEDIFVDKIGCAVALDIVIIA